MISHIISRFCGALLQCHHFLNKYDDYSHFLNNSAQLHSVCCPEKRPLCLIQIYSLYFSTVCTHTFNKCTCGLTCLRCSSRERDWWTGNQFDLCSSVWLGVWIKHNEHGVTAANERRRLLREVSDSPTGLQRRRYRDVKMKTNSEPQQGAR